MGTRLPRAGLQGWWAPQGTWTPAPRGKLLVCGVPPLVVSMPGAWLWLDRFSVPPARLDLALPLDPRVWNICSPVFRPSILRDGVSYAVVVLVCLWEEVSSGLSSSPSWSGILKELYLNFSQTHAEFPPLWKSSRMDAHFKALFILGRALHTKRMWS